jgi:hypothetical protein
MLGEVFPFGILYSSLGRSLSRYIEANHFVYYKKNRSHNKLLPASVYYDRESISKLNDPRVEALSEKIRQAITFMIFSFTILLFTVVWIAILI